MSSDMSLRKWPTSQFHFAVKFGEQKPISFQEVSGLGNEQQTSSFHAPGKSAVRTIRMPGLARVATVTLKRGLFPDTSQYWQWFSEIGMNTVKRETIIISLLDEVGDARMRWTLTNAWPLKVSATDLKNDGSEIAVDSIEIAYERVEVQNA